MLNDKERTKNEGTAWRTNRGAEEQKNNWGSTRQMVFEGRTNGCRLFLMYSEDTVLIEIMFGRPEILLTISHLCIQIKQLQSNNTQKVLIAFTMKLIHRFITANLIRALYQPNHRGYFGISPEPYPIDTQRPILTWRDYIADISQHSNSVCVDRRLIIWY